MSRILALCIAFALAALPGAAPPQQPSFEKIYPLKPEEGVFAYARISPSGKILAYASEMPDPARPRAITQTVTVVDLSTREVTFTEPGIDAYWSNDGQRMIFLSMLGPAHSVAIRHQQTGEVIHEIAPVPLGDYFSWAARDGKDLILTIRSNYYYLNGDRAVLPHSTVPRCDDIGVGDRPLVSKDGTKISTFVRGAVVVRGLDHCRDIVNTGIQGAKADFSWDGRYVAFHAAKKNMTRYEIHVVDLERQTDRTIAPSSGSSLFPSWTKDGRLCFRYDGDDYRGFMMATDVLAAPEHPLPSPGPRVPATLTWTELFPETPLPAPRVNVVMIWSSWSAHSPLALAALQQARVYFSGRAAGAGIMTALELSSRPADVARLLREGGITLPRIPLAPERLAFTEALNQIPTELLFRDGILVDRRLGAQSFEELRAWIEPAMK